MIVPFEELVYTTCREKWKEWKGSLPNCGTNKKLFLCKYLALKNIFELLLHIFFILFISHAQGVKFKTSVQDFPPVTHSLNSTLAEEWRGLEILRTHTDWNQPDPTLALAKLWIRLHDLWGFRWFCNLRACQSVEGNGDYCIPVFTGCTDYFNL